jgi:hypothetical protein
MADQALFSPMRALDADGAPVAGALAYFYTTGTASLVTIYDADGAELENPLEADGDGFFVQVFADVTMRVNVTDADGASLPGYPIDPAPRVVIASTEADTISYEPTDNCPETNVQDAITYVADTLTDLSDSLGTFSTQDVADRVIAQASWNAGTSTTDALISPLKLKRRIDAQIGALRFTSADQTFDSADQLVLAHSLDSTPIMVAFELECTADDAGYVVGNIIQINPTNNSTYDNSRFNSVLVDDTNITIRFSDSAAVFVTARPDTGAAVTLDNSKWTLRVHAFA